jgi:predicted MPP superfamily phosphohydrolase
MYQYTNRGIGTSELQLRINCPPEITLFRLRGETPQKGPF